MVTIFPFEVYGIASDGFRKSSRWGTAQAIAEIASGRIIEGASGLEVDESVGCRFGCAGPYRERVPSA